MQQSQNRQGDFHPNSIIKKLTKDYEIEIQGAIWLVPNKIVAILFQYPDYI